VGVVTVLAAFLYLVWAVAVGSADASQNDALSVVSYPMAEMGASQTGATVVADPSPGPLSAVGFRSGALGPIESSAAGSPSDSCTANGTCPPLGTASCNTVVRFDTRDAMASTLWNDYNCVNHSVFSPGSLTYDEVGYTVDLGQVRDFSLAVPLVMSDGLTSMNVFAGIFSECDNSSCLFGSENKELVIYRHAIYVDDPVGTYTTVLDSDNMNGFGDMIVACGSPNSGWCSAAYSADITCSDYTIDGTTQGGPDNIIFYDAVGWQDNYAYDGPERVYRIQVTDTSYFSFTLHYSGSETLNYKNYMSYFILDDTCDQRDVWANPESPNSLLIGEETYTMTQSAHLMTPGTYYLVVDGVHLPTQGDAFKLDVQCAEVEKVLLPLALRNYPPIPALSVNPSSGPVGTQFTFTGINFTPGEIISQWFIDPLGGRTDLSDTTANSQGQFGTLLTLTGPWPTGTYTFYARGAQSQHTAGVNFQTTVSAQMSFSFGRGFDQQ
jgi:hypothetical protein